LEKPLLLVIDFCRESGRCFTPRRYRDIGGLIPLSRKSEQIDHGVEMNILDGRFSLDHLLADLFRGICEHEVQQELL